MDVLALGYPLNEGDVGFESRLVEVVRRELQVSDLPFLARLWVASFDDCGEMCEGSDTWLRLIPDYFPLCRLAVLLPEIEPGHMADQHLPKVVDRALASLGHEYVTEIRIVEKLARVRIGAEVASAGCFGDRFNGWRSEEESYVFYKPVHRERQPAYIPY